MRSPMHFLFFLFSTGGYAVKLDDDFIFLPRRRTEPRAFFFHSACCVLSGFGNPLSIYFVLGTSRLRSLSCYKGFFVVHALPARLLARRGSPMTHAEWHNNISYAVFWRDVCCAPCHGGATVIWWYMVMYRVTRTQNWFFCFPLEGKRGENKKWEINQPNNGQESSIRFGYFLEIFE